HLFAVRADEPDLGHADAVVDTRFGADGTSLGPFSSSLDRSYPEASTRKAPHDSRTGPPSVSLDGGAARGRRRDGRKPVRRTENPPASRPVRWEVASA